MLAIPLLIFASLTALGTLAIIGNSRMSGGARVWITFYNVALIVTLIVAALQFMN